MKRIRLLYDNIFHIIEIKVAYLLKEKSTNDYCQIAQDL